MAVRTHFVRAFGFLAMRRHYYECKGLSNTVFCQAAVEPRGPAGLDKRYEKKVKERKRKQSKVEGFCSNPTRAPQGGVG